ncbi:hypothetical protein [Desulfosediminicola sp.]|uniref:hypothetical protein n=1 Tax=Desulfosediminicola sp. TaxID=2886825 RepID=UPI003AF25238
MKILHLLLILLLISTTSSMAEDDPLPVLDQISPAWERLDILTQSYLTDEQQISLQKLAFAAAVADICDGFEVNGEKFIAAFQKFDSVKEKEPTNGQGYWYERMLVAYGIATGLFTAEGLLVSEQFCKAAEELKSTSTDHYWKSENLALDQN